MEHIEKDPGKRMDICKACPHFWKITRQCSICKCFMVVKTKIPGVKCPDKPRRWQDDIKRNLCYIKTNRRSCRRNMLRNNYGTIRRKGTGNKIKKGNT